MKTNMMLLVTDTCQTIGNKVHGIFYKRQQEKSR